MDALTLAMIKASRTPGGGESPFYIAYAHWDDMNGDYLLDGFTGAAEIVEAANTKFCVIVAKEVNGDSTIFHQSGIGSDGSIKFVHAAPNKIVSLSVIRNSYFLNHNIINLD